MNILKGKNQFSRLLFLIISIILLIQLLIPTYVVYDTSSYITTHFVYFYFGLSIYFNFGISPGPHINGFSVIGFLGVSPLIVALILLIILLIKCNKLKRGALLGMGITSVILIIASPILIMLLASILSPVTWPPVYSNVPLPSSYMTLFYPSQTVLFILFGLLVGLGLTMILKEIDIGQISISKVNLPKVKIKTPEQTICVHCGAFMKPGSQFCEECGIEIII